MKDRPKPVCKDCKKRNPGCHSKCQDYISFKKELEEYYKEIRKKDSLRLVWNDYMSKKLSRR